MYYLEIFSRLSFIDYPYSYKEFYERFVNPFLHCKACDKPLYEINLNTDSDFI